MWTLNRGGLLIEVVARAGLTVLRFVVNKTIDKRLIHKAWKLKLKGV